MGESDLAGSTVTATREVPSCSSPHGKQTQSQNRPGRFTFASYVDSIKEGIKKISGYNKDISISARRREGPVASHQHPPQETAEGRRKVGGIIVGVKRKSDGRGYGNGYSEGGRPKRKTSFEMFLSTLPKCDPVDRTVVWVYQQPENVVQEPIRKSYTSLPQRGTIVPLPQPPMTRVSTVGYDTSISYCESDRGTHGRGTPPPMEVGQPRLDDLFRQLHVKQEHQARKLMVRQGQRHLTSRNLKDIEATQLLGYPPGITPELLPFLTQGEYYRAEPPTILHKNSFYYNQGTAPGTNKPSVQTCTHCCEWGDCLAKFSTTEELFQHVQDEHISVLPSHSLKYKVRSSKGHQLVCGWRSCTERGNIFGARYKLLLHVQTYHFKENKVSTTSKGENEDLSPETNDLSPPPIQYRRQANNDHKNPKKSFNTKHPTERNSLLVTSYPFPEVSSNKQQLQESKTIGVQQGKRRRTTVEGQQRTVLQPLQPARTQDLINDKTKSIGR